MCISVCVCKGDWVLYVNLPHKLRVFPPIKSWDYPRNNKNQKFTVQIQYTKLWEKMYSKHILSKYFSDITLNIFKIKEGKGTNINLSMPSLPIIWVVKIIKTEYSFK